MINRRLSFFFGRVRESPDVELFEEFFTKSPAGGVSFSKFFEKRDTLIRGDARSPEYFLLRSWIDSKKVYKCEALCSRLVRGRRVGKNSIIGLRNSPERGTDRARLNQYWGEPTTVSTRIEFKVFLFDLLSRSHFSN